MKHFIVFLLLFLSSLTTFGQDCAGPTYYATRNINVYQDQSSKSAVVAELPKGNSVRVEFSSEEEWWEICYYQTTDYNIQHSYERGWVKKAYLTRTEPTQTDEEENNNLPSNSADQDQGTDVGFEPFLAKANAKANFRNSPSTSSGIIRQLTVGTKLYIFSKQDVNSFYKAIDIKTGKIGWVNKSLVNKTGDVDISSEGAFQGTGTTSDYNSKVTITNKSSYTITLVVGGEAYYLDPKSTETKSISPGKTYYIATAPGVIPASGYQDFGSYQGYEWSFWVETRRN